MRKAIVAGQFYESGFNELDRQIRSCFEGKFGPGDFPTKRSGKKIIGVIAPHAGYMYSGQCQAWAYKEIAESAFPDVYILLGLSHAGLPTCLSLQDWETPFGIVRVDGVFARALMEKGIRADERAHSHEHSIEVQLPFLQFVNKDRLNQIRIVPLIASEDINYQELAEKLVKTVDETGKRAVFIASSDFTHFGISYGYMPFHRDIKKNMYDLDKGAVKLIEEMKSGKFLQYVDETKATICGKSPIAVAVEACRMLGAENASLLCYYTSADIVGDYSNAVGYSSIAFR